MGDGNIDPLGFEKYSIGGGGDIGFEIDFSTIFPNPIGLGYTLGVEGGMMINTFQNDNDMNINFYSTGERVSLIAQGGNVRNVGRVFGVSAGTTPANNYGGEAIFVGSDANYWAFSIPMAIVPPGDPNIGLALRHGANATNAQFSSQAFWTTAPMSFGSQWRINGVSQGWPSLANVGGQ